MSGSPVIYNKLNGFILSFAPFSETLQPLLCFRQIFFQQKWKRKRN